MLSENQRTIMHCLTRFALAFCVGVLGTPAFAQTATPDTVIAGEDLGLPVKGPVASASRIVETIPASGTIVVDGMLDEPAWMQAPAVSGFVQRDPVEGAAPTERTEVFVLYDEEALYVGARLHDTSPDSIVARLGRRDSFLQSDRFVVFLDPYLDRRSGYFFSVNAAGTLDDGILLNDSWDDLDWDGVWQGRAHIDGQGWTVELRIPYSQLRFFQQDEYVWGINFRRDISRKLERDYLVYQPRGESGFVSRFWDLTGIQDIRPRRQLEIIPYATTHADFKQTVDGSPFHDGSRFTLDAGVDMRLGITPNLTLNGTVNPDFGQVEVDPAVINLSDVETFYPEKRPFFIEGASIFQNFGQGGANDNWGFNWSSPSLFYSRRIGRAPHGVLPDHTYADVPDGSRILGAAKLTGKVGGTWNAGMVHALTARESADLEIAGARLRHEAEPATYYGVYRLQQEFGGGRHGLGVLSTLTNRFFNANHLRQDMNERGIVAGLDGWATLDSDRVWVLHGWTGTSHVSGSTERMLSLQQSSLHYFQRPDAGHVSVDSSATAMTGFAGRVSLNKQSGNVIFNSAVGTRSPSYNNNDLGFVTSTDVINGHIVTGYRWPEPGRFFREASLATALFGSFDYEGNRTWSGIWSRTYLQFLNYLYVGNYFVYNPSSISPRRTRGGPLMRTPPGYETGIFAGTDERKPFVVDLEAGTYQAEHVRRVTLWSEIEWKPAANLSIALNPTIQWEAQEAQWVDSFDDPLATATFGRRYVFADLEQRTISSSVRLNWTFTPQMSVQLYAQPLISTGKYAGYKELARARSFEFNVYGENGSTFDPETLTADPDDAGPAPSLALPRLDFNVASLRGTAVFRWEYLPGSTLYLVWTQLRSESTEEPEFHLRPSINQLWSAPMDNVIVLKLTYWLGR